MSGIRGGNTAPELIVRRFLHRHGFRFRLHKKKLPGKPDIVLPKYRAAVLVHGCFWHRHPGCRFAVMPKSNAPFWREKLGGNVKRDRRNLLHLSELGWKPLVVWECEVHDARRMKNLLRHIRSSVNVL